MRGTLVTDPWDACHACLPLVGFTNKNILFTCYMVKPENNKDISLLRGHPPALDLQMSNPKVCTPLVVPLPSRITKIKIKLLSKLTLISLFQCKLF